jgi:hypothetical protein
MGCKVLREFWMSPLSSTRMAGTGFKFDAMNTRSGEASHPR